MDKDKLIEELMKLPKGTQIGFTTDLGLNKILWQPCERVTIYSAKKNEFGLQLSDKGKTKVAVLR